MIARMVSWIVLKSLMAALLVIIAGMGWVLWRYCVPAEATAAIVAPQSPAAVYAPAVSERPRPYVPRHAAPHG